eukprot:GHVQ01023237.1.p1 GENE.GHVQ01023237.1~~GHVQ01023237.1.p1  ORF type:complete len:2427 (-),score=256.73 GHVQ01023237.1:1306-8043(-)
MVPSSFGSSTAAAASSCARLRLPRPPLVLPSPKSLYDLSLPPANYSTETRPSVSRSSVDRQETLKLQTNDLKPSGHLLLSNTVSEESYVHQSYVATELIPNVGIKPAANMAFGAAANGSFSDKEISTTEDTRHKRCVDEGSPRDERHLDRPGCCLVPTLRFSPMLHKHSTLSCSSTQQHCLTPVGDSRFVHEELSLASRPTSYSTETCPVRRPSSDGPRTVTFRTHAFRPSGDHLPSNTLFPENDLHSTYVGTELLANVGIDPAAAVAAGASATVDRKSKASTSPGATTPKGSCSDEEICIKKDVRHKRCVGEDTSCDTSCESFLASTHQRRASEAHPPTIEHEQEVCDSIPTRRTMTSVPCDGTALVEANSKNVTGATSDSAVVDDSSQIVQDLPSDCDHVLEAWCPASVYDLPLPPLNYSSVTRPASRSSVDALDTQKFQTNVLMLTGDLFPSNTLPPDRDVREPSMLVGESATVERKSKTKTCTGFAATADGRLSTILITEDICQKSCVDKGTPRDTQPESSPDSTDQSRGKQANPANFEPERRNCDSLPTTCHVDGAARTMTSTFGVGTALVEANARNVTGAPADPAVVDDSSQIVQDLQCDSDDVLEARCPESLYDLPLPPLTYSTVSHPASRSSVDVLETLKFQTNVLTPSGDLFPSNTLPSERAVREAAMPVGETATVERKSKTKTCTGFAAIVDASLSKKEFLITSIRHKSCVDDDAPRTSSPESFHGSTDQARGGEVRSANFETCASVSRSTVEEQDTLKLRPLVVRPSGDLLLSNTSSAKANVHPSCAATKFAKVGIDPAAGIVLGPTAAVARKSNHNSSTGSTTTSNGSCSDNEFRTSEDTRDKSCLDEDSPRVTPREPCPDSTDQARDKQANPADFEPERRCCDSFPTTCRVDGAECVMTSTAIDATALAEVNATDTPADSVLVSDTRQMTQQLSDDSHLEDPGSSVVPPLRFSPSLHQQPALSLSPTQPHSLVPATDSTFVCDEFSVTSYPTASDSSTDHSASREPESHGTRFSGELDTTTKVLLEGSEDIPTDSTQHGPADLAPIAPAHFSSNRAFDCDMTANVGVKTNCTTYLVEATHSTTVLLADVTTDIPTHTTTEATSILDTCCSTEIMSHATTNIDSNSAATAYHTDHVCRALDGIHNDRNSNGIQMDTEAQMHTLSANARNSPRLMTFSDSVECHQPILPDVTTDSKMANKVATIVPLTRLNGSSPRGSRNQELVSQTLCGNIEIQKHRSGNASAPAGAVPSPNRSSKSPPGPSGSVLPIEDAESVIQDEPDCFTRLANSFASTSNTHIPLSMAPRPCPITDLTLSVLESSDCDSTYSTDSPALSHYSPQASCKSSRHFTSTPVRSDSQPNNESYVLLARSSVKRPNAAASCPRSCLPSPCSDVDFTSPTSPDVLENGIASVAVGSAGSMDSSEGEHTGQRLHERTSQHHLDERFEPLPPPLLLNKGTCASSTQCISVRPFPTDSSLSDCPESCVAFVCSDPSVTPGVQSESFITKALSPNVRQPEQTTDSLTVETPHVRTSTGVHDYCSSVPLGALGSSPCPARLEPEPSAPQSELPGGSPVHPSILSEGVLCPALHYPEDNISENILTADSLTPSSTTKLHTKPPQDSTERTTCGDHGDHVRGTLSATRSVEARDTLIRYKPVLCLESVVAITASGGVMCNSEPYQSRDEDSIQNESKENIPEETAACPGLLDMERLVPHSEQYHCSDHDSTQHEAQIENDMHAGAGPESRDNERLDTESASDSELSCLDTDRNSLRTCLSEICVAINSIGSSSTSTATVCGDVVEFSDTRHGKVTRKNRTAHETTVSQLVQLEQHSSVLRYPHDTQKRLMCKHRKEANSASTISTLDTPPTPRAVSPSPVFTYRRDVIASTFTGNRVSTADETDSSSDLRPCMAASHQSHFARRQVKHRFRLPSGKRIRCKRKKGVKTLGIDGTKETDSSISLRCGTSIDCNSVSSFGSVAEARSPTSSPTSYAGCPPCRVSSYDRQPSNVQPQSCAQSTRLRSSAGLEEVPLPRKVQWSPEPKPASAEQHARNRGDPPQEVIRGTSEHEQRCSVLIRKTPEAENVRTNVEPFHCVQGLSPQHCKSARSLHSLAPCEALAAVCDGDGTHVTSVACTSNTYDPAVSRDLATYAGGQGATWVNCRSRPRERQLPGSQNMATDLSGEVPVSNDIDLDGSEQCGGTSVSHSCISPAPNGGISETGNHPSGVVVEILKGEKTPTHEA